MKWNESEAVGQLLSTKKIEKSYKKVAKAKK